MPRVELWVVRVVLGLVVLLVVGAIVGGVIYGPRLNRALVAAETGKATTAVSQAETGYEAATGAAQARTQATELALTLNMKETTREILASPQAGALASPDVYGAFSDGVRRNRSVQQPQAGGDRAPGADPAPGTAAPD